MKDKLKQGVNSTVHYLYLTVLRMFSLNFTSDKRILKMSIMINAGVFIGALACKFLKIPYFNTWQALLVSTLISIIIYIIVYVIPSKGVDDEGDTSNQKS